MSRTVARSTLRTRIRRFGDWENATDRITDAEINDAIDESIPEMHEEIVRAGGYHKRTDTSPANTTQGTQTYALASDVLHVLNVKVTSNGVTTDLTRYDAISESMFSDESGGQGVPRHFAVMGDNLWFLPTPDGTYSYTYSYVPTSSVLGSDGATVDGIHGFDKLLIYLAVAWVAGKNKEWELHDKCHALADRQRARIFDQAKRRNPYPPQIVDVRGADLRNMGRKWKFFR